MLRAFFGDGFFLSAAAKARLLHSRWLTRALQHGGGLHVPRIPTRKLSEGGFGPIMATREGQEWAEDWWQQTLDGDDLDAPSSPHQ